MCGYDHTERHILCLQCDMLLVLPKVPNRHKVICPQCKTILKTEWDAPYQRLTAYAVTAIFMLILSHFFPFIKMKIAGITKEINLMEIPLVMFSRNCTILGIFFLLFVQIIPILCLIIILFVTNKIGSDAIVPIKIFLAKALFQLKNWGMVEIFLAGVLISFIKLMKYGDIEIGNGLLIWCLGCVLQFLAFQCVDRRYVWNNINSIPLFIQPLQAGVPGIQQNLCSCPCCTAILPIWQKHCPRCRTLSYPRRKNSLQWTMVLLITSIILYVPANIFPIIITDLFGNKTSSTILDGVILLWSEGSYFASITVLIASIIAPLFKMITIAWLCCDVKGYCKKHDRKHMSIMYKVLKLIGRWSMIDVFVVIILSTLMNISRSVNVYPATGALIFTFVVTLTIFSAIAFDPRLLWDRGSKPVYQDEKLLSEDIKKQNREVQVQKIRECSPIWIFPIITTLIGAWILFHHYSHQGPIITLIATDAEGIEEGKTTIKSHSVNVGIVENMTLTDDLNHVKIKAHLNSGMGKLLHSDSVFWIVKPKVGVEGISGLGTLFSGAYIEIQPGTKNNRLREYQLLNSPPLAPPDAKGIRIILDSKKAGQLNPGDPVLFRGYRVGYVESNIFDPKKYSITYQIFIEAPNDHLVTSNVRFWKESSVLIDLNSSGMRMKIGSLATLFNGGISFDVPEGLDLGQPVSEKTKFQLYDDQQSIQNSLYIDHIDYLMFFKDSVRGLKPGAPIEFRGIRFGTVAQVPFIVPGLHQALDDDYRIPILIHIEPERLVKQVSDSQNIDAYISELINRGLRGSLKTGNLVTGALYIDMDFYPKEEQTIGTREFGSYKTIPTMSNGLAQIQQRLINSLDKINNLPLNPMIDQMTNTLNQSRAIMQNLQTTLNNFNKLITDHSIQQLPQEMQKTLYELNRSIRSFQPGSVVYNKITSDMQSLNQVLHELEPILKRLNKKSNSLIFKAKNEKDLLPKKAKKWENGS